ncbi:hypothetical protein NDU88_000128 [Pleurodeles waltl]|uniref:Uncharacterized protein n=1 Tax=Pleurodeles waltl TaxID=8319 RepID=A0AAV7N762_PLEWA|nr:hypothetical protein NDU88_000128 [Pleurodeles waltl]
MNGRANGCELLSPSSAERQDVPHGGILRISHPSSVGPESRRPRGPQTRCVSSETRTSDRSRAAQEKLHLGTAPRVLRAGEGHAAPARAKNLCK